MENGNSEPLITTTPARHRLLFVCMGNICRSPTAEAVFRHLVQRTAPGLSVELDSAGTHDYHLGHAPDARAQQTARRHGIDMSGLRARQLERADFERFDLLLVMDEDNLQAALALAPPACRERLRLLLDFAPDQPLREVPDPYYGDAADFERVFRLTERAAQGLIKALRSADACGEPTPARA